MSDSRIICGDCVEVLGTLADNSVHCVVTSPPYWGLRDYGVGGQMGLEKTPDEFIAKMVDVFREVRRVLREDGTCWANMGDSYASGKGTCYNPGGGAYSIEQDKQKYQLDRGNKSTLAAVGLKPKDLCGIPWRLALALQADGWWLRQDIIWQKPNPIPESVTDRCTKAHEYVFLLTKAARYFYDAEAVKEPSVDPESLAGRNKRNDQKFVGQPMSDTRSGFSKIEQGKLYLTRNRRSVWTIATEAFAEAHFATFPTTLVEPCVKAGTSEHGCCPVCGAPWVRVVKAGGKRWTYGGGRA